MARIRTIKPDFFKHEELYKAEKESGLPLRVAFAGLWTVADREGRFKWKPGTIKLDVLPFDSVDMVEVLAALIKYGFIKRYLVAGKEFGLIPSFKEHQVINNRESHSVIPEPVPHEMTPVVTRAPRVDHAAVGEGKGKEGKGKEDTQDLVLKYVQSSEPKIETTIPQSGIIKQAIKPYIPPELFRSKEQAFDYLRDNYHVMEDAKKTISSRGWAAVDEVDVVGLIKIFVTAKAKLDEPPEEIQKHFKNWIFREPLKNLTELAEHFKRKLQ